MNSLVAIQHWLYGGMASGLGEVAGGDLRAIFVAMASAMLFGAVHALMPGYGKTILVSYQLRDGVSWSHWTKAGSKPTSDKLAGATWFETGQNRARWRKVLFL